MASNDFNADINDFKDMISLMYDIFDCVFDDNQCELVSLIMKENISLTDRIEITKDTTTDIEKLRFYTFFMILLSRAKNQSIKKPYSDKLIQTKIASEKIFMTLGKWIRFVIDPIIYKIDHRIKLFISIKEVTDDFNIAKIKFIIENYFLEKQPVDIFKNSISQRLNVIPENCPRTQKLINSIIGLCDLWNCIGSKAFDLCLEHMLIEF
jgi:hypothetical protein